MRTRLFACLLTITVMTASTAPCAAAEELATRWKRRAMGSWAPVVADHLVVVRQARGLQALRLDDGSIVWETTLAKLNAGQQALTANGNRVYVLTTTGLRVLDAATGTVLREQLLDQPEVVLAAEDSVYVSAREGVRRYDRDVHKLLGSTTEQGHLEAVDGDYVVLHRRVPQDQTRKSPNRLVVVSLVTGMVTYEFKLLPHGGHRVIRFDRGRVSFLDFSRLYEGANPRKLYYTEADAVRGKKLRDLKLSSHYGYKESDNFAVTSDKNGRRVYLTNYGVGSRPSSLLAYEPRQNHLLWTRSGNVAKDAPVLHNGRLWTTVDGKSSPGQVVAYNLDSGDTVARYKLDAPVRGSVIAAGVSYILARTSDEIWCFGPPHKTTASDAPVSRPGWRPFHDRKLHYSIQLPQRWQLARKRIHRYGHQRVSIPFVLYRRAGNRPIYVASVHVLIRPAGNDTTEQLWQAVVDQRRQRSTKFSTIREKKLSIAGAKAILGSYRFTNRAGVTEQARSLCIVSGGLAYELRGRVNPKEPRRVWREMMEIFSTFKVTR